MNTLSGTDRLQNGSLVKNIILFTLPIALSSMVQQLFNSADTAVAGHFGSTDALAAVGTNTETVALIVTLSAGLSVGVNVLIAAAIGKKQTDKIPEAVTTSLMLALAVGAAGAVLGFFVSGALLRLIHTPSGIFEEARRYLRIYFAGYPFLLLYDFGAAALRARGESLFPFLALTFSGGINVGLNLLFTGALGMGVSGVAAATDIANGAAAVLVLVRLKKTGMLPVGKPQKIFSGQAAAEILKTGVPSAVQGAVFCLANIFVQSAVNSFGEDAIAGSAAAMNFEYFVYYIITAFGQSATTFTSRCFAAGNMKRCRDTFRLCIIMSAAASAVLVAVILLFGNGLLHIFSTEAPVIRKARERMMCILLFEPLCCFFEIPAGVLRDKGRALYAAVSTTVGICAVRLVWLFTVFRINHTLPVLFYSFALSWLITTALVWLGFLHAPDKKNSLKLQNGKQHSRGEIAAAVCHSTYRF